MFIEIIAEIINNLGSASGDIIFTDYNTSYRNIHRRLSYNATWEPKEKIKFKQKLDEKRNKERERQKFYNLLSYLKHRGLVEKRQRNKSNLWSLTSKGLVWLKNIKNEKLNLKKPFRKPENLEIDELKIIVFDIPEVERHKRNWLRQSLYNLDFSMLQKSVWVGKTKLPEEFIKRLQELKILSCIHIFTVKETGTINLNL